jgi:hypothetical protein
MEIRKVWQSRASATLLMSLGAACSDAGSEEGLRPEDMQLGQVEQAFAETACGRESVTANVTVDGTLNDGVTSPTVYNKCTKSFIVDITNLNADETGTGTLNDAGFSVIDVGPRPTTAAECNGIVAAIITYERVGNQWIALERNDSSGFAVSGPPVDLCFPPQAHFFGAEAGKTYRIAATVRDANNNTRAARISHAPAEDIPQPPR